jgi:hypothetical protein
VEDPRLVVVDPNGYMTGCHKTSPSQRPCRWENPEEFAIHREKSPERGAKLAP